MNTAATKHFHVVDDLDIAAMTFAIVDRIEGLGVKINRNIRACAERMKTRRALAKLNDHLLADIGLTRAGIETEICKPVWQN